MPCASNDGTACCPGFGLTLGFSLFYLCLVVLIPLAALALKAASFGWEALWAGDDRAARPRLLPAHLRRVARRRARQRRLRPRRGLGARALPLPRPARGRRARRPALRAAHRRRRASRSPRSTPRRAGSGGPLAALGVKVAFTPARRRRRPHLHRPALRGAHAAAGARGARPRGGGGGGQPGREPRCRPSSASSCPRIAPGLAHRRRPRLRPRARRVRLGRLHLRQHADEDRDRARSSS